MAEKRHGFAFLNKNRVVVFIMTIFGGVGGHTGRALHRECMSGSCCGCFCSNISEGPRVGPNLIAHVSSIYK